MRIRGILAAALLAMSASACGDGQQAMASDKIAAADVQKALAKGKSVSFSGKHITGDIDFTQAGDVPSGLTDARATVSGSVVFVDCVFEGRVTGISSTKSGTVSADFLRDVVFEGCVFQKDVDFTQCVFRGRVKMEKCSVKGGAVLNNAMAQCGITLNKTEFEGMASLDGLRINGPSGFSGMKFRDTAVLQNIRAECNVMMVDCTFDGVCDFSRSRINGDMNLSNAKFGGRVTCQDARIYGMVTIGNATFNGNVICENTIVDGCVKLDGSVFNKDIEATRCTLAERPDTQKVTITEGIGFLHTGNSLSSHSMNTTR